LRHADQKAANLEVHTDVESKKVEELKLNPNVGIHIWFPTNKLQVRIKAISEIKTGSGVTEQWEKVPTGSRVSYGTLPTPGTIIQTPFAYEKPAEFERFCVIKINIEEIDLIHLGTRHTRALYEKKNKWCGSWLAP
jgi:general stress protein 26